MLNKGIDLSMLQHYILERIAHVTWPSIVSRSLQREGDAKGYKKRTTLVKCIARTISETIRAHDLREPREHAKFLHPWQEGGV